jgi:hypothetical protein
MTRGKASTSAWNRPGSPQRRIGTTKDLRREGGRATARGAIIAGTFCPSYNHAKQPAHQLCPSQRPALRCPALNRAGVTLVAITRIDELDLPAEIAPELTGHGLPLSKCEAYNRVYDQF